MGEEKRVVPSIGIEPIMSETTVLQTVCPPWATWHGRVRHPARMT